MVAIKESFSETDSRLKLFATESEVFQFTAKYLTEIIETTVSAHEDCNVIVAAGRISKVILNVAGVPQLPCVVMI